MQSSLFGITVQSICRKKKKKISTNLTVSDGKEEKKKKKKRKNVRYLFGLCIYIHIYTYKAKFPIGDFADGKIKFVSCENSNRARALENWRAVKLGWTKWREFREGGGFRSGHLFLTEQVRLPSLVARDRLLNWFVCRLVPRFPGRWSRNEG